MASSLVRRSIAEQGTPAQVDALAALTRASVASTGRPAVFADGATRLVIFSNWTKAGFFELDARSAPDVNLSYFGLMPHAIGRGLGDAFLRRAVDAAWMQARRGVTVNTCTADHKRALPTYLRAGFRTVRTVREQWEGCRISLLS